MKPSMNKITAFLAALLLSFAFAACCLRIPEVSTAISARGNLNLLTFAMQLVLFCLFFLAFYGVFHGRKRSDTAPASAASRLTLSLLIMGSLLFFLQMFRLEVNIYGGVSDRYIWHRLPLWLVLFCLALEIIIFFLCLRSSSLLRIPDSAMYLLYGMLTVLTGYAFYTPSIFVRGESDRLHAHAYFNSIYNVCQGQPYSEHTTSIYGHYGILYKLPMKLLGGDFIDFILLNTLLGALCFFAVFLALHFTVKNNLLRILGAIAVTFPILSMRGGFYWQLWPHRILFMSLMFCLGAVCIRFQKQNAFTCVLGYLLALLSILWNTESGIFCVTAWAAFWILFRLCTTKWNWRNTIRTGILHIGAAILCFFGAYGIVNLYNLSCGGSANSLREFLFPLLTSSYMDDLLRVDLPDYPSAYIPVLILLYLAVARGLSHMTCFTKKAPGSQKELLLPCYCFFIGVLSLGQISYFMNRAAYHNLDICHLPSVLLLCILAEQGMEIVKRFRFRKRMYFTAPQLFQGAFTAVALSILLTLNTGTLIEFGHNMDIKTVFRSKQELHDFAAHIAAHIPKDTYAFGIGAAEIYSILRWDTQCYTLDFSDLSIRPQVADQVIEDIRQKDLPAYLVGENTYKKFKKFAADHNQWLEEHYRLAQEFEFQGAEFGYYTKK